MRVSGSLGFVRSDGARVLPWFDIRTKRSVLVLQLGNVKWIPLFAEYVLRIGFLTVWRNPVPSQISASTPPESGA